MFNRRTRSGANCLHPHRAGIRITTLMRKQYTPMKKTILSLSVCALAFAMSAQAEPIVALTSDNRLITFDSATPGTAIETVTITGLGTGENLVGIDYRPATGTLYGLSTASRVYAINSDTGVATAIGAAGAFTLNGTSFGFDFNPVPDRIRVTSDTDQNLRLNPNDGTLTANDGTLQYAGTDANAAQNPNIVGSAYTNSFAGAQATVLYDIDSNLDILTIQNPPNNGTLVTVGSLGVDTSDRVGFDISGTTGVAYASLTVGGVSQLYTINLLSGAATATATPSAIRPTTLGTANIVDIAAFVNPGSRLDNISTRGRVGASDQDFLIAGFISRGGVSSRILVRAIGPSLSTAQPPVTGPLADPVLELFDGNGAQIATNDQWKSDQQAEIAATDLAPQNDNEAAILRSLAPGNYTAVVSGKDTGSGRGTGTALVEVYQLRQ
jgi:hypothetical protein